MPSPPRSFMTGRPLTFTGAGRRRSVILVPDHPEPSSACPRHPKPRLDGAWHETARRHWRRSVCPSRADAASEAVSWGPRPQRLKAGAAARSLIRHPCTILRRPCGPTGDGYRYERRGLAPWRLRIRIPSRPQGLGAQQPVPDTMTAGRRETDRARILADDAGRRGTVTSIRRVSRVRIPPGRETCSSVGRAPNTVPHTTTASPGHGPEGEGYR